MNLFSDAERERITEHIAEVEAHTAGEVVPYVVMQSDAYPAVRWRGAAIAIGLALAVGSLLPVAGVPSAAGVGSVVAESRILVPILFSVGVIGALIAGAVPLLVRTLAGAEALDRAAHRRAMQAFVDEEVFATRDRTGILMFVSLLEHRIEVIADVGISEPVDPATWSQIAESIRDGMAAGSLADGLVDGLIRCQSILEEAGIERRADDTDELPNTIREKQS
jgi:putative membrane protein